MAADRGVEVEVMPQETGLSARRLRNLDRLVEDYVDSGKLPGAVWAVARRGRIGHVGTYGTLDARRAVPARTDTIFRIYSMTKPIVSVALIKRACSSSTTVANYLRPRRVVRCELCDVPMHLLHPPGCAARAFGQLYVEHGVAQMDGPLTLAESVDRLARLPLAEDPGTRWRYGISTDVIGRLCEVLTGSPLDEFLRNAVFEPLGMHDTGFHVPADEVHRLAACFGPRDGQPGYRVIDDPRSSAFTAPRAYLSGAAGLVSTARDYLRFCFALTGHGPVERLLAPHTVRFMTTNQLPGGTDLDALADHGGETQRPGQGFGLGFAVLIDPVRAQLVGTPGEYFWGGAASTTFFVSPADDLVVVFLTQLRPSATYPQLRRQLRATTYGALLD